MKEFVIASLSGIVGVVIGVYFTYFIGIRLQRRQEKFGASSKFISAFIREVRKLESKREPANPGLVFINGIRRHMEAATYFKYFLKDCEQKRFSEDWNIYYSQPDAYQCTDKEMAGYRQLLLDRIKKLLEYAGRELT